MSKGTIKVYSDDQQFGQKIILLKDHKLNRFRKHAYATLVTIH